MTPETRSAVEAAAARLSYLISPSGSSLASGHRRIVHLGGENENGVLFLAAQARRNARVTALLERGLSIPDELFMSGGYVVPQAKVAARALLRRRDRPPRSSPGTTRWPSAP